MTIQNQITQLRKEVDKLGIYVGGEDYIVLPPENIFKADALERQISQLEELTHLSYAPLHADWLFFLKHGMCDCQVNESLF